MVNKREIRGISFTNPKNRINKKGQQMTLGTIIAIVLGIAVLVLLIFGFGTGWANLWGKITAFGGGDVNVDTIVQACALQCSARNEFGFCTENRTLNNGTGTQTGACKDFKEYGIDCPFIICKI